MSPRMQSPINNHNKHQHNQTNVVRLLSRSDGTRRLYQRQDRLTCSCDQWPQTSASGPRQSLHGPALLTVPVLPLRFTSRWPVISKDKTLDHRTTRQWRRQRHAGRAE